MPEKFAYITNLCYLCGVKSHLCCKITHKNHAKQNKKHKIMKEILKKVPHPDYLRFRQAAIMRMGWTVNQYKERYNGRTPLASAEREVLEKIVEELNQENLQ